MVRLECAFAMDNLLLLLDLSDARRIVVAQTGDGVSTESGS
jgi:hypothetical protein